MTFIDLLSYSDHEIETILDAVSQYCERTGTPMESQSVKAVLHHAIELFAVNHCSGVELADALSQLVFTA